eukprot:5435-Rhodomonas_salina.2
MSAPAIAYSARVARSQHSIRQCRTSLRGGGGARHRTSGPDIAPPPKSNTKKTHYWYKLY